jgi:hypothetical protein
MEIGEEVTIKVKVTYGEMNVTFKIIGKLSSNNYLLLAQDKLVIGTFLVSGNWCLSEPIDLLEIPISYQKTFKQI